MPVTSPEIQVSYVTDAGADATAEIAHIDARCVVEGRPVREFPVYVGRRNCSGFSWSSTMCGHVVYESLLELSWLWLADFDPQVVRIAAQPMRMRGRDALRARTRIPDFLTRATPSATR